MDISFHYYAVKSIARAAGYPEEQAQRIATFSQFIDDYNWYVYFPSSNIPDYVKADGLDIVFVGSYINPVTTGFIDYIDLSTLILPRSQKFTVCPFHFIPQDKASRDAGDNRTVPATLNDASYISDMLNAVKKEILSNTDPSMEKYLLMKMGALCHTFADTYAHQLFTGFNNQTNSVKLLSVRNNITGADETAQYNYWIGQWVARIERIIHMTMPTIGHMAIAHVPDLTHLSFSMQYRDLQGVDRVHSRSNTEIFVKASNQLYNYFRSCLGSAPANMSWDDLQPMLAAGFLFDCTKEMDEGEQAAVKVLTPHWSGIFTDYSYQYDSTEIKGGFILSTSDDVQTATINGESVHFTSSAYSDDFYHFNLYADQLLIVLYGKNPRSWV